MAQYLQYLCRLRLRRVQHLSLWLLKLYGVTLEFLKDMFAFLGNAMIGLVIAVFAAAILMEAYDFVIDSWGLLFG